MEHAGFAGTFALLLGFATGASAQLVQECSVADGAGGRLSGGGLTAVTAVAQPGGVEVSAGGTYTHYAGFLGCVTLLPSLDTDGDGLDDELDPDNDDDGLSDLVETGGGAFNPATITDLNDPDSDDDGAEDGAEAVAGTDPHNNGAFLRITDLTASAGNPATVSWVARGGKSYRLWYEDDLVGGAGGLVTNLTALGGVAPWFETTASADDLNPGVAPDRAYHVEVLP